MLQKTKAVLKLLFFLLWTGLLILPQALVLFIHKGKYSYIIPKLWHKGVCLVFGLRYRVIGTPLKNKQTLYVSNHISYLDIPVIGCVLNASFVAKSDVENWPLFGILAKLSQTAFVSRARQDTRKENNHLGRFLKEKKSLIMFPEATSTNGAEVKPFKSSLLAVMFDEPYKHIPIQPFTIQITKVNGEKQETQAQRDIYAWYREEDELVPHLWTLAKNKGVNITLFFHEPLTVAAFENRKSLSKACHHVILESLTYETE